MISVLVPCLGRPHRAAQVADSIRQNSTAEIEVVFLTSPGDDEQHEACVATGERVIQVDWPAGPGDYARKMNLGYRETKNPYMLLAADDLRFQPRWDTEVLKVARQTRAGVIGTNDMGNPEVVRKQLFSTHPLITREYIKREGGSLDGPGFVCHEGYDHNFVDRELWDLAASRLRTAFAINSRVEHLHPHWGKSEMDETYEKGLKEFHGDQRLYWSRCEMWGKKLTPREIAELNRWRRRDAREGRR